MTDIGEFNNDDVLPFFGDLNVRGEGGLDPGVGGRSAVGGGVREGGTERIRDAEV